MVFPLPVPVLVPDQNIQKRFFQGSEGMYFRRVCSFLLIFLFCGGISSASSLPEENTVTYSFIHISDPQSLTTNYPETLDLTFSSIESLKKTYNISAIVVTGDVVNTWNDRKDWDSYAHARNLTTIPIYEIAGNHDTGGGDHYEYYTAYSGEPAENYVTSLSDFDFVGINYAGTTLPPDEFSRLRGTLTGSSRSHAIIATHYYMDEGKNLSPLGEDIDTYLVVKPSLVLMGHMHANFVMKRTVGGFPTVADMTNYQDGVPGGTTGWDYSAGTLYNVTSVNGQVKTITARVVHIYPVSYIEEEITVFGDNPPGASLLPGTGREVTEQSVPVTPHSSCSTGGFSCIVIEFVQQCWTDFWHFIT
jgi:predicted MPP superfamily phosphohydrolase